jgi:hypothetical protein
MAWFAAHLICYFKYREGKQDVFPVWENVYLVEAEDSDSAWEKAEKLAEEMETDSETLELNDKPAQYVYAGIRKLISVFHWEEGILKHGDEITYSEFNVFDEKDIQKLVDGEEVKIEYIE